MGAGFNLCFPDSKYDTPEPFIPTPIESKCNVIVIYFQIYF
jgi:hypothetical protein